MAELAKDGRSGVQKLVAAYYKKQQAEQAERERFAKMLMYENNCYNEGAQFVAGVDEAGRGPLAGPMVIGAVILPQNVFIGMAQVLESLKIRPQAALIDAMPVQAGDIKTYSLIHGDALSASIAAASVIAKVTRDRMMEQLAAEYPQYGWAHNKGYGSAEHMQAVLEYGATSWHRRSYEPVKSMHLPPAEPVPNKIIRLPEEADG